VNLNGAEHITLPAAEVLRPIKAGQPWTTDDALCPICETVFLMAASFTPQAPSLPLPSASQRVERFEGVTPLVVAERRSAFQSRAPPSA
jgi:hypothetical protein